MEHESPAALIPVSSAGLRGGTFPHKRKRQHPVYFVPATEAPCRYTQVIFPHQPI